MLRAADESGAARPTWTKNDLSKLLKAIGEYSTRQPPRGWDDRHDTAFVLIVLDTDLDLHTCLELRKTDLSDAETCLKGAHRLSPETVAALRALPVRSDTNALLPWPYGPKAYWSRYRKIRQFAGLPCSHRDSVQKLRRTARLRRKTGQRKPNEMREERRALAMALRKKSVPLKQIRIEANRKYPLLRPWKTDAAVLQAIDRATMGHEPLRVISRGATDHEKRCLWAFRQLVADTQPNIVMDWFESPGPWREPSCDELVPSKNRRSGKQIKTFLRMIARFAERNELGTIPSRPPRTNGRVPAFDARADWLIAEEDNGRSPDDLLRDPRITNDPRAPHSLSRLKSQIARRRKYRSLEPYKSSRQQPKGKPSGGPAPRYHNEERDAWMYDLAMRGWKFRAIRMALKSHPEWSQPRSDTSVRMAINAFADRNRKPRPAPRKRLSPKPDDHPNDPRDKWFVSQYRDGITDRELAEKLPRVCKLRGWRSCSIKHAREAANRYLARHPELPPLPNRRTDREITAAEDARGAWLYKRLSKATRITVEEILSQLAIAEIENGWLQQRCRPIRTHQGALGTANRWAERNEKPALPDRRHRLRVRRDRAAQPSTATRGRGRRPKDLSEYEKVLADIDRCGSIGALAEAKHCSYVTAKKMVQRANAKVKKGGQQIPAK